jgi:hypothetical protein
MTFYLGDFVRGIDDRYYTVIVIHQAIGTYPLQYECMRGGIKYSKFFTEEEIKPEANIPKFSEGSIVCVKNTYVITNNGITLPKLGIVVSSNRLASLIRVFDTSGWHYIRYFLNRHLKRVRS